MTWLVWKSQHSHGMSPTYHKLSRNFGGIVRYCSPHPLIHDKSGKEQVNYILLWLGPQGVEIYDSWNLSETDQQDTKKVWDVFSAYFEPKSSFRLSRYQLQNIKQEEKEPVDSFVRRMKTHSQKCKFPPKYVDDHHIDQFIVGVAHNSVRKNTRQVSVQSHARRLYPVYTHARSYWSSVSLHSRPRSTHGCRYSENS